jgi:hypothetical protein
MKHDKIFKGLEENSNFDSEKMVFKPINIFRSHQGVPDGNKIYFKTSAIIWITNKHPIRARF